jgi:hypothetical protein
MKRVSLASVAIQSDALVESGCSKFLQKYLVVLGDVFKIGFVEIKNLSSNPNKTKIF